MEFTSDTFANVKGKNVISLPSGNKEENISGTLTKQ